MDYIEELEEMAFVGEHLRAIEGRVGTLVGAVRSRVMNWARDRFNVTLDDIQEDDADE
jgi:hypothetical protein